MLPEDMSKDKRKKANFSKSCTNFKMVDGHLTYIGKKGQYLTIIDMIKLWIPQYHSFRRLELQKK